MRDHSKKCHPALFSIQCCLLCPFNYEKKKQAFFLPSRLIFSWLSALEGDRIEVQENRDSTTVCSKKKLSQKKKYLLIFGLKRNNKMYSNHAKCKSHSSRASNSTERKLRLSKQKSIRVYETSQAFSLVFVVKTKI